MIASADFIKTGVEDINNRQQFCWEMLVSEASNSFSTHAALQEGKKEKRVGPDWKLRREEMT